MSLIFCNFISEPALMVPVLYMCNTVASWNVMYVYIYILLADQGAVFCSTARLMERSKRPAMMALEFGERSPNGFHTTSAFSTTLWISLSLFPFSIASWFRGFLAGQWLDARRQRRKRTTMLTEIGQSFVHLSIYCMCNSTLKRKFSTIKNSGLLWIWEKKK